MPPKRRTTARRRRRSINTTSTATRSRSTIRIRRRRRRRRMMATPATKATVIQVLIQAAIRHDIDRGQEMLILGGNDNDS